MVELSILRNLKHSRHAMMISVPAHIEAPTLHGDVRKKLLWKINNYMVVVKEIPTGVFCT
jgi:hypothetical protein